MCRSIKPLFNFEPASSTQEVEAAALQFVRKVSGYRAPSKANEEAFNRGVAEIAQATQRMLDSLTTNAAPHHHEHHHHQHLS